MADNAKAPLVMHKTEVSLFRVFVLSKPTCAAAYVSTVDKLTPFGNQDGIAGGQLHRGASGPLSSVTHR